ncbi:MAG: CoB--CoM heterodisulfide reductase iron-sulfur subunit B family protein [Promethearchaeota archaeon]
MINSERLEKIPTEGPFFLFRSCMVNEFYPAIETAFKKILDILNIEYYESDDQICCGGVFSNFEPELSTAAIAAQNFSVIEKITDTILVNCNECFSSLQKATEYFKDPKNKSKINNIFKKINRSFKNSVKIFHVTEFIYKNIDKIKKFIKFDLNKAKIATFTGCHWLKTHKDIALDNPENPIILDEIVERLGGIAIQYTEKTLCCGMGYVQKIIHPDLSLEISFKKLKSINYVKPDIILTICPNCMSVLDTAQIQIEIEKDIEYQIPVIHLSQLIGLCMGLDPFNELALDLNHIDVTPFLEKLNLK